MTFTTSSGVPDAMISPPESPPFGPKIDDPVSGLYHFKIVFDHNHRVPGIHQLVQHLEQLAHIFEMQPRGRLVQDVKRAPGGAARQLL